MNLSFQTLLAKLNPHRAFTFATYNVRGPFDRGEREWARRRELVRNVFEHEKFDLLGVQEATALQLDDLLSFGGYARIGAPRDNSPEGEYSAILYRPERFEVRENGTFWLSETPDVAGSRSWLSACPRIATWGVFHDRASGNDFACYNTHLDHVSSEARMRGLELILRHMNRRAEAMPALLSGDFNATPESDTYASVTRNLRDSERVSQTPHRGGHITFNAWGNEIQCAKIDYLFATEGVKFADQRICSELVDGKFPSDHYPVAASVRF